VRITESGRDALAVEGRDGAMQTLLSAHGFGAQVIAGLVNHRARIGWRTWVDLRSSFDPCSTIGGVG
jgi:hypothetical protein